MFQLSFSSLRIAAVGCVGALILWAIRKTLSVQRVGLDGDNLNWPEGSPRIIAVWHGQQLLMPWVYLDAPTGGGIRKPFTALISKSGDGRMIAEAMRRLGVSSVAGSSSRGGREALFLLTKQLKQGSHIAITPDGPKGPRHKLKQGVLRIAQLSGAPIHGAALAGSNVWQFGSWDGMILPKPFSRITIVMGPALFVRRDASTEELEALSVHLENELNRLSESALAGCRGEPLLDCKPEENSPPALRLGE